MEMRRSAVISSCGLYRYKLVRTWDDNLPRLLFIMLNPSTADGEVDDATIRNCIARAQYKGFGALEVVNLFAYRATQPKDLYTARAPIGNLNDAFIMNAVKRSDSILCAWGIHGTHLGRHMQVLHMLKDHVLHCLGETRNGQFRHPLYIPAREEWESFTYADYRKRFQSPV